LRAGPPIGAACRCKRPCAGKLEEVPAVYLAAILLFHSYSYLFFSVLSVVQSVSKIFLYRFVI